MASIPLTRTDLRTLSIMFAQGHRLGQLTGREYDKTVWVLETAGKRLAAAQMAGAR
jgi:hypothetical protein